MTILALIERPELSLVSTQLVYSAEETGALRTAMQSAEHLAKLASTREQLLEDSQHVAREAGYAAGYEDGLQAAQQAHANALHELGEVNNLERARIRDDAMDLALNIVRHIASKIDGGQLLAALAHEAAEQLEPDVAVQLRVHPALADAILQRIDSWRDESEQMQRPFTVIKDSTLARDACHLETAAGSLIADLETQLAALRQRLQQGDGNVGD